jgi:very-short-patch-repair endonuclease
MTKPLNKYELKLQSLLPNYFGEHIFIPEYQFDVEGTGEFDKKGNLKLRKWRFDFAQPYLKIAFEVEGGTWTGGRHVNPIGYAKDCEKYNAAVRQGWSVFRLTPQMINEKYLDSLLVKKTHVIVNNLIDNNPA